MLYKLASNIAAVISDDDLNLPNKDTGAGFLSNTFQRGLQVAFALMGAIAVLIITIAALQYVISGGDPGKTAKAKDTILYAVIGLVVALSAYLIVTFVLDGLFS